MLTCAKPCGEYGDTTWLTCGSRASFASIASTRARTAGSVTLAPPVVAITTRSVSPDCDGATDFRRSMARVDSVCGSLKSFE